MGIVLQVPSRYGPAHRWAAVEALYALADPKAREMLVRAIQDPDSEVAAASAESLALLHHGPAVPAMIARLNEAQGELRSDLAESLADLTGENFKADAVRWEDWWKISAGNGESR